MGVSLINLITRKILINHEYWILINIIYKVNKFSDMTKEEFKVVHACYKGHQTPMISTRSKGFSIND